MKIKQILKTARVAVQQAHSLVVAQQNATSEQADQIVKKHEQQLKYKQELMAKGNQLLQKYTKQYTPRGFEPGDPRTKEFMGLGVIWSGETELPRNFTNSLQNNPAISGLQYFPQQIKQHQQEINKYKQLAKQPQAKQTQQPQQAAEQSEQQLRARFESIPAGVNSEASEQPQAKQQVQQPQAKQQVQHPQAKQQVQQPQAKHQVQQPQAKPEAQYVVQKGDTLSGIAKKLQDQSPGLTWQTLAKHNKLADPNKIEINQRINIPST